MAYTNDQYLILSQLAYIDIGSAVSGTDGSGQFKSPKSIMDVNEYFKNNNYPIRAGGLSKEQIRETLEAAANDPDLKDLQLVAQRNHNVDAVGKDGTGLVAYVFETTDGKDRIYSFRGSEGDMLSGSEDWKDNFNIADTKDSKQNRDAIDFVESMNKKRGTAENNHATGHSLGGSDALVVAGVFSMEGAVFNARGIPPKIMDDYKEIEENLENTNYTSIRAEGDVVSSLDDFTWHPDNEITVEGRTFRDEKGNVIQPTPPRLAKKVSNFYDDIENLVASDPILKKLIADILANGLIEDVMNGDIIAILKLMGYSLWAIFNIRDYIKKITLLLIEHHEAIEYLFTTQNNASQPNIFTPHYTQTLQDPNRKTGAGYSASYRVMFSELLLRQSEIAAITRRLLDDSEQISVLAGKIDTRESGMKSIRFQLVTLSKQISKSADSVKEQAAAINEIHRILSESEKSVYQSFYNLH